MKKIVKKLSSRAIKFGFPGALLSAIAGLILAFFSTEWSLSLLALGFIFFITATALSFSRIYKSLSVTARRIRAITHDLEDDSIGIHAADSKDERILRELHLRTLEEVRILHAELINHLDRNQNS